MATYLVTGGAGFIGSHYIRLLLGRCGAQDRVLNLDALTYAGDPDNLSDVREDPRYRFIHGDIRDGALAARVFKEDQPDYVIHFAAESHVDRSIDGPDIFVQTNVAGTETLLRAASEAWEGRMEGKRFLQVSTDEVYGSLGKEGLFSETSPIQPRSPYSASKAAADLMVKAYASTYGLPVNITRCSNNYGPNQHPEKLIPHMIECALRHEPLPVYGDGMQIRDWLYVTDHCQAIDLVLTRGVVGEIYNIGGRNEHTNMEIVTRILSRLHDTVDATIDESLIRHVTDRKGHDRRYAIDADKIIRELGWQPKTQFCDGIDATIDWYVSRFSKAK